MGKIQEIKMSGCPVFDGDETSLECCTNVNFIYGANGSGKSTISNYLRNLSDPNYSGCTIEWENNRVADILVYNKNWRDENFGGHSSLPGVFTLGSGSVKAQAEIEKLKADRDSASEKRDRARENHSDKQAERKRREEAFADSAWKDIFKPNDEKLGKALKGYRNNKSIFCLKLLEESETGPTLTKDELTKQINSAFAKDHSPLDQIDSSLFAKTIEAMRSIEKNAIWQKVITGNQDVDISLLINKLGNSDWVRKGQDYIDETEICPFCQSSTINASFRAQLETFFDEQYELSIHEISSYENDYEALSARLSEALKALNVNEEILSLCPSETKQLNALIPLVSSRITNFTKLIKDKMSEPSRKLFCPDDDHPYDEVISFIDDINKAIEKRNSVISDIKSERFRLSDEAWRLLRKENALAISEYKKSLKEIDSAIKGLTETIAEQERIIEDLREEIIEVQKNVTSIQPAIDNINRSLLNYGFDTFNIEPSPLLENSYQIVRSDGSPAEKTLSEGEETFVAFLYFMQTIEGTFDPDHFSSEKIIVIDDPICSLDSTVLYIVSCLVKQLINQARETKGSVKQVFVFTHNTFFHKEASLYYGKSSKSSLVKYWMIQKQGNKSVIKSFGTTNPIKTSYELLWKEIRNEDASSINVQNIMRRIIENYFGMLGSKKNEEIEEQFDTVEDKVICKSLFAWMNDGSHSIPDDLYIDSYSESPEKYRNVFREVFIKTGNEEHYKMMMGSADY